MRRRYVVWLTAATIVGAFVGALWSWAGANEYRASTRLFVTTNAVDVSDVYQATLAGQQRVLTYKVLASDLKVLSNAVRRAGTNSSPLDLAQRLHVDVPPATIILDIGVDDTNAETAATLANAVADELIATINELERPLGGGPPPVGATVVQRAAPSAATLQSTLNPVLVAAGAFAGLIVGLVVAVAVKRRLLPDLRAAREEFSQAQS
ncbi:hypothetical protein [Mycobacterium sp. UM_Kg1]|uniref:YveK family protein n=1 Tax=Mycobacterium sp. UM_Kg1 TaxID=1545691 RepID=UPI00061B0B2F|nr:hypothetical protein [Mycobacterium sp. UM_Kg1]